MDMAGAEKLMKQKAFIKRELEREVGQAQADAIWSAATRRLEGILRDHADLPKGVRLHTDNYIFSSAAIYLAAKDAIGQEAAYRVVENAAIRRTEGMGRKLAGLMRLPGMKGLFLRMWDPLTRKVFSANNGFTNVFYPREKGVYRMDVTACPYCRYFTELGCFELTKVFCANDDRCYGSLPGLEFRRAGTLGRGADRCDFYMRKL